MHIPSPLLFLLTASGLAAQSASFVPFGAGCTFGGQTLAIGNQGLPQVGQTFRITYAGPNHFVNSAQQSAWPQLGLGFQTQHLTIPTNWFPAQPAGCIAELLPDLMIPTPHHASLPQFESFVDFSLPNDPGLVGVAFFAQWLTLHQQCGIVGCGLDAVLLSDAAIAIVGP